MVKFVTEDGQVLKVAPQMPEKEDDEPGAGTAFLMGGANRVVDNILGLPQGLENLGNSAQGGINDLLASLTNQNVADFLVGEQTEPEQYDVPEAREIFAALDAGTGTVTGQGDFDSLFADALGLRQDLAAENPTADTLGGFSGDVLSLLTGRAPRSGAGGLFDEKILDTLRGASTKLGAKAGSTGTVKQAKEIIDSELFQDTMRGLGRGLETGLEGAALAIVQDGDPLETFGLAAGGQLASSGALTAAGGAVELPLKLFGQNRLGKFSKTLIGATAQGVMLTTLFQVFQKNPDAAEETAFDKLTTSLVIGGTLGLAGKRSKPDGVLKNFPTLADAILTVPRTGMIKVAQSLAEDPDAQLVAQTMASNPDAFTQDQLTAIQAGIEGGDLSSVVRDLSEDSDFRAATGITRKIKFVPTGEDE